ncbi:MBL fold metallo-hydrolase [Dictyobacter kobayashii]|uniref:Metallo-beta-lactamase domain-containing protein n=1 Tax=Dictyobacter kobayashii TaxID=2014872 RepID=A0A402AM18_9CHLR|nr:MBL fold metallo-hydrolase [Dictyobacter kobayashii]GCE20156.1 hypothetical protein KDK_39560 [Dictyobacter kobayashii]
MAWQYTKGLHDIGNGIYAYLQSNGSWGWSNSGLIVTGEDTLLVDTLYDMHLTGEMHETMSRQVPAAKTIQTIVNTHADGDHTNGNGFFPAAKIISSKSTAEEMQHTVPPQVMANMLKKAPPEAYMRKTLGAFHFDGITQRFPTETFEGHTSLSVGAKKIELFHIGPAHTDGDTLVYLPQDRVMFTGDIVFAEAHPVVWAGPVSRWIYACDFILEQDVNVIVPGHGPVTDKSAVATLKQYFVYLFEEAEKRYKAGMNALDAAYEINYEMFSSWKNPERMIPNVAAVYREISQTAEKPVIHETFALMSQWNKKKAEQADATSHR